MTLTPDDIRALAAPVPRYTSYPTAPHFHAGVDATVYGGWLSALPDNAKLSLYFHVPFCDTLCWFCGCHTKITRRYEPVRDYLDALMAETATLGMLVPAPAQVTHIHWGGGSPTMLKPDDIRRLSDATKAAFRLDGSCDFAVEIDPRGLDDAHMDALVAAGLTRVSIGVQDFDIAVQQAINRIQSVEETRRVVDGFRARGVSSLNIDAIYGLPHQTRRRLENTLREVVRLRPDRIALFGYAHVPWMKKHMSMIEEEALADVVERYHQAELAAALLVGEGYERIGIDHFALPHDSLAIAARAGTLQRNFQGYPVAPADALLGLGASAIGSLPQGYVQNTTATPSYMRAALEGRLAAERGVALSEEDRLRRAVIEQMMCGLEFSTRSLAGADAGLATALIGEARAIVNEDTYGFIEPTADGFRVTEAGRPFLRSIAARFDGYLKKQAAKHSLAV